MLFVSPFSEISVDTFLHTGVKFSCHLVAMVVELWRSLIAKLTSCLAYDSPSFVLCRIRFTVLGTSLAGNHNGVGIQKTPRHSVALQGLLVLDDMELVSHRYESGDSRDMGS